MAFADVWFGVAGGVLIGMAASLLLLVNGRVAGIGTIFEYVVERDVGSRYWRPVFLLGLLLPAPFLDMVMPHVPAPAGLGTMLVAGLLMGVGIHLCDGCISSYAICGNARFSRSAQVATVIMIGSGMITVFIVRHVV